MRKKGMLVLACLVLVAMSFPVLAQDWTMDVVAWTGDRTASFVRTFGVHAGATDYYDYETFDVPFLAPPSGPYAVFPLLPDDPYYGTIAGLSTDIRGSEESEVIWRLQVLNDFSEGNRLVTWDIGSLPLPEKSAAAYGYMYVGVTSIGGVVTSWTDMSEVDSATFGAVEEVQFRFVAAGAEDSYPPEVSNIEPGDEEYGVALDASIEFDITDDVNGVDLSTLVLNVNGEDVTGYTTLPIVGGYHIIYTPAGGFEYADTVYVTVSASDLSEPPREMEPYSWQFYTEGIVPPDLIPPYSDHWTPDNGAEDVSPSTNITFQIHDGGVGVDTSTIVLIVNGATISHSVLDMTEIGAATHDYAVIYDPLSDLPSGPVGVQLHVEDFDGNALDTTIAFTVGEAGEVPDWTVSLTAWSYTSPDTSFSPVYIGMMAGATELFDPGIDVPIPVVPPGFYAWFPISDPDYPEYTMLQTDIREATGGEKLWVMHFGRPGALLGVRWDSSELLPGPGYTYMIGAAPEGVDPTYSDMRLTSHIEFPADYLVYIKFRSGEGDVHPPQIVDADPADGARGVSVATDIYFEIVDASGVDRSSLNIVFDGEDVTSSCIITPLEGGYSVLYVPLTYLEMDRGYQTIVTACDEAIPSNCMTDTLTFYTTGAACYEWTTDILFFSVNGMTGDTTTRELAFGTDEAGSDMYEPDLDVVYVMPPPSGPYAWFPLSDPAYPHYEMLSTDIRDACAPGDPGIFWNIYVDRLWDSGGSVSGFAWSPEDLPGDTMYAVEIGVAPIAGMPDTWLDMREETEVLIETGEKAVIHYYRREIIPRYSIIGTVELENPADTLLGTIAVLLGDEPDTFNVSASGQFRFDDLWAGTYNVLVHRDGYIDTTLVVTIEDADVYVEVTLYLPRYTVSGVITLEGASAGEYGGTHVVIGTYSAYTDDDGAYEIPDVLAGEYDVVISHEGYATFDTTLTVEGDTEFSYELPLPPGFDISGTVTLEGAEDFSGTVVEIVDLSLSYTTETDGAYLFEEVEPGLHTIRYTHAGYEMFDTTINLTDNVVIDVTLTPANVTVSGTADVSSGPDSPAGTEVSITAPGFTPTITNSEGYYEFADVPWGEWTISATREYYAPFETTLTVSSDTTVDFALIYLEPPADLVAIGDTLERPITEEGKITLEWTLPYVAGITLDHFDIYRSEEPFTEPSADLLIDTAPADTLMYYEDYDIVLEETYYYAVVAAYDEGDSRMTGPVVATTVVLPDDADVLVYDFDNAATPIGGLGVEAAITGILDELDVSYTVSAQDATLDGYELTDYDAVIVCLGVHDADDAKIDDLSMGMLISYLEDENGQVYVEGPDFGKDYFSSGTAIQRDFFNLFGIHYDHDGNDEGTGNVRYIVGDEGYFGIPSVHMDYSFGTIADRLVDEFSLDPGTNLMYTSQDSAPAPNVSNIRGSKKISGYKAYYSSIYVGALVEADYPNVKSRILGQVLCDFGITCAGVDDGKLAIPTAYSVGPAFPNPFNPTTDVRFELPEDTEITLDVFDIAGKKIATIASGHFSAGVHTVTWDAGDSPSGIYFYRLTADEFTGCGKVILLK